MVSHRRVVVVGYEHAELIDIACITTPLGMANLTGNLADRYQIVLATPGGKPITCDSGLVLQAQRSLERVRGPIDTLVVSGGLGHRRASEQTGLVAHVRRLARESRRVASVCTGATVLAATGLLNGRRATTHWRFAPGLRERFPEVLVDPDPIFIRDGNIATAAGVTSAMDLMLAFIEEDHGAELAQQVARELVTYLQRPGKQAQMSIYTTSPVPEHPPVRRVTQHILASLAEDLSNEKLAAVAGVSARQLTRLFLAHLGETPSRFVRKARTDAAARLLADTSLTVAEIAARCGFGTPEALRQSFVERFGTAPSRYRAMAS